MLRREDKSLAREVSELRRDKQDDQSLRDWEVVGGESESRRSDAEKTHVYLIPRIRRPVFQLGHANATQRVTTLSPISLLST